LQQQEEINKQLLEMLKKQQEGQKNREKERGKERRAVISS